MQMRYFVNVGLVISPRPSQRAGKWDLLVAAGKDGYFPRDHCKEQAFRTRVGFSGIQVYLLV